MLTLSYRCRRATSTATMPGASVRSTSLSGHCRFAATTSSRLHPGLTQQRAARRANHIPLTPTTYRASRLPTAPPSSARVFSAPLRRTVSTDQVVVLVSAQPDRAGTNLSAAAACFGNDCRTVSGARCGQHLAELGLELGHLCRGAVPHGPHALREPRCAGQARGGRGSGPPRRWTRRARLAGERPPQLARGDLCRRGARTPCFGPCHRCGQGRGGCGEQVDNGKLAA